MRELVFFADFLDLDKPGSGAVLADDKEMLGNYVKDVIFQP